MARRSTFIAVAALCMGGCFPSFPDPLGREGGTGDVVSDIVIDAPADVADVPRDVDAAADSAVDAPETGDGATTDGDDVVSDVTGGG